MFHLGGRGGSSWKILVFHFFLAKKTGVRGGVSTASELLCHPNPFPVFSTASSEWKSDIVQLNLTLAHSEWSFLYAKTNANTNANTNTLEAQFGVSPSPWRCAIELDTCSQWVGFLGARESPGATNCSTLPASRDTCNIKKGRSVQSQSVKVLRIEYL